MQSYFIVYLIAEARKIGSDILEGLIAHRIPLATACCANPSALFSQSSLRGLAHKMWDIEVQSFTQLAHFRQVR